MTTRIRRYIETDTGHQSAEPQEQMSGTCTGTGTDFEAEIEGDVVQRTRRFGRGHADGFFRCERDSYPSIRP